MTITMTDAPEMDRSTMRRVRILRSLNNNNKSNLININENSEQTFRNNNMNIKNNYNYNINSSYIDTKEAGQKRTLDNFRMLLDKMDKKIN